MGDGLPKGQKEILDESPSEKLWEFLLKAGCDTNVFRDARHIFNPSFDIDKLIENLGTSLFEEIGEFEDLVQGQVIRIDGKDYLHLTSITKDPIEKAKVTKRFRKLGSNFLFKPPQLLCPSHMKPCNTVLKLVAFIFFLYLKVELTEGTFEDQTGDILSTSSVNVVTLSVLDKEESSDPEEPIDVENEKELSSKLDVSIFKAETAIADEDTPDVEDVYDDSMIVTALPTFFFNGKSYILVSHIQHLYNLREDYCLAIIAEGCDAAKGFVDIEEEPNEEFLKLDTDTSVESFVDANNALALCVRRANELAPSLKDEDFEERQVNLGIHNFGREFLQTWSKQKRDARVEKSVNLNKDKFISKDENQQVNFYL